LIDYRILTNGPEGKNVSSNDESMCKGSIMAGGGKSRMRHAFLFGIYSI
jgi:hypothetical protein